MTRQDQIIEAAKFHAKCMTSDKDLQVAFADAIRRGAEWADEHPGIDVRTMAAWRSGYQAAIGKACEWLEEEYPKAAAYYEHPDSFIDRFKQATKVD